MSEADMLCYCPDLLQYARRESRAVMVGKVGVGGENPIRVQSMITADTRDTPACVDEVLQLAEAGCEIVRITAQTKVYAANLENIAREVRSAGCEVPLVADIHFKPDAALEAAKWVEKIRVNPGNYADKKKFEIREYSDEQYADELERIREQFNPLVELCKEKSRSMRIGTNHGSLSDRIMNRYGDTPLGMVESALEFARIARDHDYHELIFSMKASNPKVMIEAYRLLVARLEQEGSDWNYPIHLGVTEAGDGEDGRIKSAVGIGSLLADGIGDTIRVSLTEDSVHEIPVATALASPYQPVAGTCSPSPSSGLAVPEPKAIDPHAHSTPVAGTCSPSPSSGLAVPRPSAIDAHACLICPDWSNLQIRTSSHLPHWRIPGATYAVTFRIKDSLPAAVIDDYKRKQQALLDQISIAKQKAGSRDASEHIGSLRAELQSLTETVIEPALHSAAGPQALANPEVARAVLDALHFFDNERYDLLAWSVMPNHVHVLLKPHEGHELERIVQSWKTHTAKEAHRFLGTSGTFWQQEYFDHIIRDGDDFKYQLNYILNNPRKGNASADWTGSNLDELSPGTTSSSDKLGLQVPATPFTPSYDPFSYEKRRSSKTSSMGVELGDGEAVRVVTPQSCWNSLAERFSTLGDFKPEIILEKSDVVAIDPTDDSQCASINEGDAIQFITVADSTPLELIPAYRLLAAKVDARHPILLKDRLSTSEDAPDALDALLKAATHLGSLLCDGIGDAVLIRGETAPGASMRLAYNILQATGVRIFKTDYVACPSCGRTLFNLQSTTQKIRAATGHLKGVRIAVMGCIVNGPGEMADADFGYVGGAPSKINLYVGKEAVKFNIPEEEAVERLIDLIKEHDKWVEPTEEALS